MDCVPSLHFDAKLLTNVTSSKEVEKKVDRLAIVITDGKYSQLLAIPKYPGNFTGKSQFDLIKTVVEDWGISAKVKAICCDTAAVNTGKRIGTCTFLEDEYGPLLHLACRKHILERVLSKVFELCMKDVSKSADIPLFVKFKNDWSNIDTKKFVPGITEHIVSSSFDEDEKNQLITFIRQQLSIQETTRKDYIELLQLCLLFLGAENIANINIRKPGTVHRARYMAKAIYSLKIFGFRHQFKMKGKMFGTNEKNLYYFK